MPPTGERTPASEAGTKRSKEQSIGGAVFSPGLRISRHRATTAHTCALYPFHADQGLGPRGVYIGEDVSAGGSSWHFDPFQLYTDGVITSPNILVLGMVGGRTYEAVSLRSFEALVGRFGAWDKVRDAPVAELYDVIQAVTFAEVKARRIKAALMSFWRVTLKQPSSVLIGCWWPSAARPIPKISALKTPASNLMKRVL